MDIQATYRQIAVKDINFSDTRYSLNPFFTEEKRNTADFDSILHPPLLLECSTEQNSFIILSGREQFQNTVKSETILTALVVPYKYADQQQQLFSLLLQHQLFGSDMSCIEQAIFCKKALESLTLAEVMDLLPLLRLKAKPHVPEQLIALLALDCAVQRGLHRGNISQRAGKKLGRFSIEDQRSLARIIEKLQLGGSKQQKLIDAVFELTRRRRISVEELLEQWREREKDKQQNGPQRGSSLLNWLARKCQPRLKRAEADFRTFCGQLKLPEGIRINHTPAFEEKQITLSIDFRSKKELAAAWPRIESVLKGPKK